MAAHNGIGYEASASSTAVVIFTIARSSATSNSIGVSADSFGGVTVSASELEQNNTNWSVTNNGTLSSYGDNYTNGVPSPLGLTVPKE